MNIFDFASRATPLHSVPASNAVKSNMAANAEFQDLAASFRKTSRHCLQKVEAMRMPRLLFAGEQRF